MSRYQNVSSIFKKTNNLNYRANLKIREDNLKILKKKKLSTTNINLVAKQFEENDKNYTQVATLAAGFSFGELALINNKPRAATVRALAPSYFAVLDKESYQLALGTAQKKRLSDRVDFLKSIPIFADWTRSAVEKLTYFFEEKEFKRNHYVFREGDP